MMNAKTQDPIELTLKEDGKTWTWPEEPDLEKDVAYLFENEKVEGGWILRQVIFSGGAIVAILHTDRDEEQIPQDMIHAHIYGDLSEITPLGSEHLISRDDLLARAAQHPAVRGINRQGPDGPVILSEPVSEADIATLVDDIIADREEQVWLRGLEIIGYNDDDGHRYLKADAAEANARLEAHFPEPVGFEADLVIEVEKRSLLWGNKPPRLTLIRAFLVEPETRFDYDTGVLKGVHPATDWDGKPKGIDGMWARGLVMNRMPREDYAMEDAPNYIADALERLSWENETPSPS